MKYIVSRHLLPAYLSHEQVAEMTQPDVITYVGWGNQINTVRVNLDLGRGVKFRGRERSFGIRQAIWDAAFGYVSGFRKRDILYFIWYMSFSRKRAMKRIEHNRQVPLIEWLRFSDGSIMTTKEVGKIRDDFGVR